MREALNHVDFVWVGVFDYISRSTAATRGACFEAAGVFICSVGKQPQLNHSTANQRHVLLEREREAGSAGGRERAREGGRGGWGERERQGWRS